jgi:hypothetical protein
MTSAGDYVTLISAEGHEFVIERRCALVSGTIKAMLTGPGDHHAHRNGIWMRSSS